MATRASTRQRTRSAKAVEAELTENLLAAAKGKRGASVAAASDQQQTEEGQSAEDEQAAQADVPREGNEEAQSGGKGTRKKPSTRKRRQTYCICRKGERGEMIECEGCNDWFHFDCVGLTADDADKIQSYACSSCTESKGLTTTYAEGSASSPGAADGEQTKPSPKAATPSDEQGTKPTRASKRKASGKNKRQSPPPTEATTEAGANENGDPPSGGESRSSSSSDADSGSDAAPSDDDDEDEDADKDFEEEPSRKKPRTQPSRSTSSKRRPSMPMPERKPSSSLTVEKSPQSPSTPIAPGGLPPARKYVADKMAVVIGAIMGDGFSEADASEYGQQVEASLFSTLNETIKGKPTAGGRYKAQFNLVHGALSKFQDLNPELIASIRDRTLTPAKVAALNSTELANAEQRAIIEKAEAEALRLHVRIKDDEGAIQAGRDGLEILQDSRVTEMEKIRRQESDARERERRREAGEAEPPSEESRRTSVDVSQSPVSVVPASPAADKVEKPPSARKVSAPSITIPRPSISIDSAWGDKKSGSNEPESIDIGEQEVDLSDMVPDTAFSDADEDMELDQDDLALIRKQAPGWSGGIVNPAVQAPPTPIELRHLAATPLPAAHWSHLIPQPNITITGRVPTATSLKYLSDRRKDSGKQLQPVLLSLPPNASQADKDAFAALVDFHVSRDRHGIYHPFGERPPPGTAREVYLIPLRANDPIPPLLGELGASVPESRSEPVIVAVFLAPAPRAPPMRSPLDRPPVPQSPFPAPPAPHAYGHPPAPPHAPSGPRSGPPPNAPTGPRGPPIQAPIGPKSTVAAVANAAPVLPNAQLQALMASLDANAIASVAKSPLAGGNSPVQGQFRPPPPGAPPAPGFGMPPFPPPGPAGPYPPAPNAYGGYGGQSPYAPNSAPYGRQSPGHQSRNSFDQNAGGYSPSGYQQDNAGGYSPSGYRRSPRWG